MHNVVLQSCTVDVYSLTAKICKTRAGECQNGIKNVQKPFKKGYHLRLK